jgi:hypothetical protein
MGAPTSDVGNTSATTRRGGGGPRTLYGHVAALGESNSVMTSHDIQCGPLEAQHDMNLLILLRDVQMLALSKCNADLYVCIKTWKRGDARRTQAS